MIDTTLAISAHNISYQGVGGIKLRPLDLSIAKGEVFGLIGPRGSGKTTLIELLTTLRQPSSGYATIAGYDACHNPEHVRQSIGFLPQRLSLCDKLSVREHLRFFAGLSGVQDPTDRVEEVMDFFNLRGFADQRLRSFNKGLRQRIGIAQAILHRPDVLFLDDPEAELDAIEARALHHSVERLQAKGMTIFISARVPGVVTKACDLMGILAYGSLVFYGLGEARGVRWGDTAALYRLYDALAPTREVAA
ncbi:ABC-2 type transport system ATP-binding protein [Rhodobacter sp. JA431]|uniref:ABC transporter ATP-binding protein n=1 Tax=Rhodobacter sp. JA431 TaxID=570013 RepID=UPI000BD8FCAE|nr:ABC transporter ATP-binding protein [Rhodobacter sp. JA431]SOC20181.1 ABC-2 type transport system ATP-binding protein [Rhodobacter sp. JA431]